MNRGIYEAASGMIVQETNLDVVANNLANVDSAGFKKRVSANADFSALLDRIEKVSEDGETKLTTVLPADMPFKGRAIIGSLALSTVFSEDVTDMTPGVVKTTENPLDMAIDGPGFFAVANANGDLYYTRNGSFIPDENGNIVTSNGMTLQGDGGAISIGNNVSRVEINRTGQIIADGEAVGRVALFTFENPTYLRQAANNLLEPTEQSGGADPVDNVKIWSGALEVSNVSVVEEMVRMIEAQRVYEGASKASMTHDEQTNKLITSFSRG